MIPPIRLRNIAFKAALIVMSLALAAFGVMGWADSAGALAALVTQSWGDLNPIWPVYAFASVACIAAQVLAACAVVNFARLAHAHPIWRLGAFAFYAVSVFFAAYSADRGAQVVLQSAHRAAYEAREAERERLTGEIAGLSQTIEAERQRLPPDTSNVVAERQRSALAIFTAATAAAAARLPVAQSELGARPPLPREAPQTWQAALGVFAIFLAWAVLEPWGYALAERGREPPPLAVTPAPEAEAVAIAKPSASVHWLGRAVAIFTLGWISHFSAAPPARAEQVAQAPETPDPILISQWQDAKTLAFSMRGRYEVNDIAAKVKRHPSTVYKWFRARDRELAAA